MKMNWQDPPPPQTRGRKKAKPSESLLASQVEQMKANPGRWARVRARVSPGIAQNYRKAGCKAVTRSVSVKKGSKPLCNIWACWPKDS